MRQIRYNIFLFALILLGFPLTGLTQETLIPLGTESIDYKEQKKAQNVSQDTLSLPFIDDFARNVGFPSPSFWDDKMAYVTHQYAMQSISIGAATLDAVNEKGAIYGTDGNNIFAADFLTSKPIDLAYTPGDSIYLSFYYQPGGLGDTPEPTDSLVVQYYNVQDSTWESVRQFSYSMEDSTITVFNLSNKTETIYYTDSTGHKKFRQTIIPVHQNKFLQKGFRFRFHNYASTSDPNERAGKAGNVDHWNIDFVRLDRNRSHDDTIINDVAFIQPIKPLLFNYESLPWQHFPDANAFEMKDSLAITYRNIGNQTWNISREFEIIDRMWDNPTFTFTGGTGDDVPPYTVETYPRIINYIFPFNDKDSALFEIKAYLITDTASNRAPYRWNDTISYLQKFYNYYAYDDGTAEHGYGIHGQGAENAWVAFKFNNYTADTLQAVQIYFNQTLDSASQNYFKLYIWDDDGGKPGNVLYSQDGYRPVYEDSVNQFHNYPLKDKLYLEDEIFYVGYEKFTTDMLNIGFDVNRINNDKLFYNISGSWIQSNIEGSLMMRPVFGEYIPYPVSNKYEVAPVENPDIQMYVYPNPARDYLNVSVKNGDLFNYAYKLISLNGNIVKQGHTFKNPLYIAELQTGIYILQFRNKTNQFIYRKKIIVTR